MAGDFPDSVVSVLSNFWVIWPNATDLARFEEGVTTADENTTITNIGDYLALESGYKEIQSRSPLQLAIAMGDSPVGFAMWIYELMHEAVDRYVVSGILSCSEDIWERDTDFVVIFLAVDAEDDYHLGDDVLYPGTLWGDEVV